MQRVIYNGNEVIYNDIGEGDPIVLLHGYLESSRVWFNFARRLATRYRVVTIDFPGHGLSETHSEIHSMEMLAGVVLEVLNARGIDKCLMVGHSLGGYVTLAFLEHHPERVAGYCLFHSHPHADSETTVKSRLREIRAINAGKKNLIYPENITRMFATENLDKFSSALTLLKDMASTAPGRGIVAILNGMIARPSRAEVMANTPIPCLWILGTKDQYIDHNAVTRGLSLPSTTRIVMLEKSGHLGFIEQEDESINQLQAFAEQIFLHS